MRCVFCCALFVLMPVMLKKVVVCLLVLLCDVVWFSFVVLFVCLCIVVV